MKVHEYQGKEALARHRLAVTTGVLITNSSARCHTNVPLAPAQGTVCDQPKVPPKSKPSSKSVPPAKPPMPKTFRGDK